MSDDRRPDVPEPPGPADDDVVAPHPFGPPATGEPDDEPVPAAEPEEEPQAERPTEDTEVTDESPPPPEVEDAEAAAEPRPR